MITVRWRDSLPSSTRIRVPEEILIGTMYDYGADNVSADFVVTNSGNWIYTGTGLVAGSPLPGLVGYECDKQQGSSPAGTINVAHSPYNTGNSVTGNGVSDATVYTAVSGATVFAGGSSQWNWGLDDKGVNTGMRSSVLSVPAQQITRNVLTRFKASPSSVPLALPVALPGGPYTTVPGFTVSFDGTGSYATTGTLVNYAGDFGDQSSGTGAKPSHAYNTTETYTVTLIVTDRPRRRCRWSRSARSARPIPSGTPCLCRS